VIEETAKCEITDKLRSYEPTQVTKK